MIAQKDLLALAMLGDVQDLGARTHRHVGFDLAQRLDWNVFELKRRDIHRARELGQRLGIIKRRAEHALADHAGGRLRMRVEQMQAIAEGPRGERGHAGELPAAQKSDGGPRGNHARARAFRRR